MKKQRTGRGPPYSSSAPPDSSVQPAGQLEHRTLPPPCQSTNMRASQSPREPHGGQGEHTLPSAPRAGQPSFVPLALPSSPAPSLPLLPACSSANKEEGRGPAPSLSLSSRPFPLAQDREHRARVRRTCSRNGSQEHVQYIHSQNARDPGVHLG